MPPIGPRRLTLALACLVTVLGLVLAVAVWQRGTAEHPVTFAEPVATPTVTAAAPTAAPPAASPTPSAVTIAFGGDVHFEGVLASRLRQDPASALGPIARNLSAADLAMVNVETAITDRGTPAPKQYVFRAPAAAFTALRSAGVDVATMANNHGMDYGQVGLLDSLTAAKEAAFPLVGVGDSSATAFAPYVATVRGQRIALLGATQVLDTEVIPDWTAAPHHPGLASAKDPAALLAAVRAARAQADTVIVYLHWGRELAQCPSSDQKRLAEQLVAAGADAIVGSHAHVLQGAGWLGSAYVAFGLGNFAFYASGSGPTTNTGVLTLTVQGRSVIHADWTPARIAGGVPVPLHGTSADEAVQGWNSLRGCTGLTARP
jgi:poly-gamma-glutamate synthesis protein (capsule biosynthesis protein)